MEEPEGGGLFSSLIATVLFSLLPSIGYASACAESIYPQENFLGFFEFAPDLSARFIQASPIAMEPPSNGGLLYHEVQEAKLCAVHCVNTVLQGPFFSEVDLAALASDLDQKEQQMMQEGGGGFLGDYLSDGSYNVSMGGDFSIQVLQRALEVWDLQVIPADSPVAGASKYDPELENAFICHLQDHWFCIRKVNGEWYNFNSLYPAPEHLSKFYLSAYLDSLKCSGWSMFLVRGNFPRECPIPASDANNGYGQWLTPDDAKKINVSCNLLQAPTTRYPSDIPTNSASAEADVISQQEEQDIRAAIVASLMDLSTFGTIKNGGDDVTGSSVVPTTTNSASGAIKNAGNDVTGSSAVPTTVNSASGLMDNDNTINFDAGPNEADELKAAELPSSVSNVKDKDNQ